MANEKMIARKLVTEEQCATLAAALTIFICDHLPDDECECDAKADDLVIKIGLTYGCLPVDLHVESILGAVLKEYNIQPQPAEETAQHLMERAQSDMRANKRSKGARMSGESKVPDEPNKD